MKNGVDVVVGGSLKRSECLAATGRDYSELRAPNACSWRSALASM